jgi:hypothetical protein
MYFDKTFLYFKQDFVLNYKYDNEKHTISLGDTIWVDSCNAYINERAEQGSSSKIHIVNRCKPLIIASPEMFDKIFGQSSSLSPLLEPSVYLVSEPLIYSKTMGLYLSCNVITDTNNDTLIFEKVTVGDRNISVSKIIQIDTSNRVQFDFQIFLKKNKQVQKITLKHPERSDIIYWDIKYTSNNLVKLNTNYYMNVPLEFFIELPKGISFLDLIINKNQLFYWDSVLTSETMLFWIMPIGYPPSD